MVLSLPSAPRKLPDPGLQAQDREERIGGVDFTTGVGVEQGDDAWAGKESGGVKPAGAGEFAEARAVGSVQELAEWQAEAGLGPGQDFFRQNPL